MRAIPKHAEPREGRMGLSPGQKDLQRATEPRGAGESEQSLKAAGLRAVSQACTPATTLLPAA